MEHSRAARHRLERFAALGLRGNPFQVVPPGEVPGLYVPWPDGPDAGELARSTEPLTQIMGPSGWGKSTLLAATEAELRALGMLVRRDYLPPHSSGRVPVPSPECRVLLIDEGQRLTGRCLRALVRWAEDGGRLIVSTHADLTRAARRRVVTVHLPGIDAERLGALFARRIVWAGGDPSRFRLDPAAADWLLRQAGGHLRVVEAALYELFQTLTPAESFDIDRTRLEPWGEWIVARAAETAARVAAAHR